MCHTTGGPTRLANAFAAFPLEVPRFRALFDVGNPSCSGSTTCESVCVEVWQVVKTAFFVTISKMDLLAYLYKLG